MSHNIKEIYPVNAVQKSMLFHSRSGSGNYEVKISLEIEGQIDGQKAEEAFKQVVERHDSFRTIFPQGNLQKLVQVVLKNMPYHFKIVKTDRADEETNEAHWEQEAPFDLEKGPLVKGCLFKSNGSTSRLDFMFHHIITDGWSLDIFLREFFSCYAGCSMEQAPQYKAYVKWVTKENMERGKQYYQSYLDGYSDAVNLEEPNSEEKQVQMKRFSISYKKMEPVLRQLKENGITLSTFFQAIWGLALNKLYNRRDLVFGSVVSGRNVPVDHVEHMIGMFINTLPVRMRYNRNDRFSDILRQMQEASTSALEFEAYPLERLIDNHPLSKDLFNHIIGVENYDLNLDKVAEGTGLKIKNLSSKEHSHFPLNLAIYPGKDIELLFTWHTDLYSQKRIDIFADALDAIVSSLANGLEILAGDIQVVDDETFSRVTELFNHTTYQCPGETDLRAFVKQVFDRSGEMEAVSDGKRTWRYKELEKRASGIAKQIIDQGCKPNDIVAIYDLRSMETYAKIFGTILSGCGFLLLDPALPVERLEGMLEDSQASVLLVNQDVVVPFRTFETRVVEVVDSIDESQTIVLPAVKMAPHDITYVIYTSGTTGKPKGVMMASEATVNMADYIGGYIECDRPVSVSVSPLSFDMFICDMFYTFARQGKMVMTTEDQRKDNEAVAELIKSEKVNAIFATPSRLASLFETHPTAVGQLKTMIVGGEKITEKLVDDVYAKTEGRLFNAYGPTETTVYNTVMEMNAETKHLLGKPAALSEIYIINDDCNPMPCGVSGEICIGGVPVSRGYLNQPELNREKFIGHPFKAGKKIYKTGDLGRWTEDGCLEYLGRTDAQVKIRGLRIETQEIEKVFSELEGIRTVTVFAVKSLSGQDELACVYTGERQSIDSLIKTIRKKLPDYMVPNHIQHVETMKMTRAGKFDKAHYADMIVRKSSEANHRLPVSDTQKMLYDIWASLLKHEHFGCDDSFFNFGGNSLNAMILCGKIKERFGKTFALKDLFRATSIISQEKLLTGPSNDKIYSLEKAAKSDSYPLTLTELRLFSIAEGLDEKNKLYNIIHTVEIKGTDPSEIEMALTRIVNDNDNLRSNFKYDQKGQVRKYVRSKELVKLEKYRVEACNEEGLKSLIKGFDLKGGRLYQFILAHDDQREVLIMNFHHIVMDGTSIVLLIKALEGVLSGKDCYKPEYQLQDYALFEENYIKTSAFEASENFWHKKISGYEVSRVHHGDKSQSKGKNAYFVLPLQAVESLKNIANQLNMTLFQLMFSVFQVMRARAENTYDHMMGTISLGRSVPECQTMMGMMVNTLPVRMSFDPQETLGEILKRQKEELIETFSNEAYPLQMIIKKYNEIHSTTVNSLFDELFILQELDETASAGEKSKIRNVDLNLYDTDTKFPMTIEAEKQGQQIRFLVNYDETVYSQDYIENMMESYILTTTGHLESLLNQAVRNIDFMSDSERETLMQFHGSVETGRKESTIQSHMDKIMDAFKDKIACESSHAAMTYKELDQRSKNLASQLHGLTKGRSVPVAVLMKRSHHIPIAVMGILRAGASFILMDTALPEERILQMVEMSSVNLILTDTEVELESGCETWHIDRMDFCQNVKMPVITPDKDDVAYMIFTSGTTGKPKGVINTNRGLMNSVHNIIDLADSCDQGGSALSLASISFDMFIIEMFMALGSGRSLIIADENERMDNDELVRLIKDKQVRLTWMTPSRIQSFMAHDEHARVTGGLNGVFLGGEALHAETLEKLRRAGKVSVFNMYGPSETSVFSCGKKFTDGDSTITIGKPSPGNTMYILGQHNELLPLGSIGEIVIGGLGVGAGYLGDEAQTVKMFVEDPFRPGFKMYRTGDLGSWTKTGEILYSRRLDNQVKVRGYRIEILEIENSLKKIEGISDAAVIVKKTEQGGVCLAAFLVGEFSENQVIAILSDVLPYYMVPEFFVKVDEIPLNHAGKIDAKALDRITLNIKNNETPIETSAARTVAKLFETVLGCEVKSGKDNFYHLGGDSIKAIQLVGKMRAEGFKVSVKDIIALKCVDEIARFIEQSKAGGKKEQGPIEGIFELLPIEKQYLKANTPDQLFNQSVVLKSDFRTLETYHAIIQALMIRHDVLRSRIILENGRYVRQILPDSDLRYSLKEVSVSEHDIKSEALFMGHAMQHKVKPDQGIMMSVVVIHTEMCDYMMMALSHFVVDGVSWRILLEDLSKIASDLKKGKAFDLYAKSDAVTKFAHIAREAYENKFFEHERACWLNHCIDDSREADSKMSSVVMHEIQFTKAETSQFQGRLVEKGTDINTALLSAYVNGLAKIEHTDKFCIFFESHGRLEEMGDTNLSQSVGWFTSMYPLGFRTSEDSNRLLRETKLTLDKVPNSGVGFGVLAEGDQEGRLYQAFHSKCKRCFNYLGEIGGMQDENESTFKMTDLKAGNEVGTDVDLSIGISFNAVIINQALSITVAYNQQLYTEENVKRLAESVTRDLECFCEDESKVSVLAQEQLGNCDIDLDELDCIMDAVLDIV